MTLAASKKERASRGGRWGAASPHAAATDAAAAVLDAGGSAVDAAIAAAGVLAVVYPHNCSLGGDLIALARSPGEVPRAIFGVGRAASGVDSSSLRRQLGAGGSLSGPLSITVPGVVSGWSALHRLGGRATFASLLEPAIRLAADGFRVGGSLARALGELESDDPGLAEIFGARDQRMGEGDLVVQPHLARTLGLVASNPRGYYRGGLAKKLAAGLAQLGSPLRLEDLHEHRALVRDATVAGGGTIAPRLFTAGLPSQGFFFKDLVGVVDALAGEGCELSGRDAPRLATAFSELSKLRDELLCDPRRLPRDATVEARLERFRAAATRRPTPSEGPIAAGTPPPLSGDTVAIVVHDAAGNSVSLLQSVFHSFGAKVLDPETGVLFHCRGAMFNLVDGSPAELGPNRLPPHTLCPVIVDEPDGSPSLVLSTMGGRGQPQILTQVLLALGARMGPAAALAAPRYVVGDADATGSYRTVTAEDDVPADVLASLAAAGFDVRTAGRLNDMMGHAQVLSIARDGTVRGGSDPRSDGTAACGP